MNNLSKNYAKSKIDQFIYEMATGEGDIKIRFLKSYHFLLLVPSSVFSAEWQSEWQNILKIINDEILEVKSSGKVFPRINRRKVYYKKLTDRVLNCANLL